MLKLQTKNFSMYSAIAGHFLLYNGYLVMSNGYTVILFVIWMNRG